ncbi:MAG: thermonuclease family protein [Microgenomates group bacterium]
MNSSCDKKVLLYSRGSASSMSAFVSLGIVLIMGLFSLLLPTPAISPEGTPPTGPVLGAETTTAQPAETGFVTRVIDGDTILLESGERVRYIGMNTPEDGAVVECFGSAATQRNIELVENKTVTLVKDVSETDRYGRLLRYVYVDDVMINELLLEEGYAQVATYPPDVMHQVRFRDLQEVAREKGRGLWGEECPESESSEPNSTNSAQKAIELHNKNVDFSQ